MEIKFKKIHIENFCGVKEFDCDFANKTQISGKNKLGKSTIKNAIYWVLYNKLSDGSSADGIRPHDESGKDIDFLEISVTLTIYIDGKSIEIKKTQRQNWVKDRATLEQKFKGNVNEYEVNGIPKKEKDFTEYIENYIPMSVFSLCTNPMVFLSLDTKKRRAKLCEITKDLTDSDVIEKDSRFVSLASDLEDGSIDELIARSKTAKSKLEQTIKEVPARIDEVSKQKIDIDVAELELRKNGLLEEIANLKAKQSDASAKYEEYKKASDGILELQFKKNDILRSVNGENASKRSQIIFDKDYAGKDVQYYTSCILGHEKTISELKEEENTIKCEIERCRTEWTAENERTIEEDSLNCPYCGQEYPEDKREMLISEFDEKKKVTLKKITDRGNELASKLKAIPREIKELEAKIADCKEKKADAEKKIASLEAELATVKQNIPENEIPECVEISEKIAEMESSLSKANDVSEMRKWIDLEIQTAERELLEIEKKIALVAQNIKIDERIAELMKEQVETAQLIVAEQQNLDVLELFRRSKMQMLSDRINEYFDVIKWRMFQEQINGGFADVCIPLVNGTSYDGTLNHGDKILAEIDICRAFQKANNVVAPIMVDDSESLDAWRVPEVDSQLIMFRRTDDKEIKVEVL